MGNRGVKTGLNLQIVWLLWGCMLWCTGCSSSPNKNSSNNPTQKVFIKDKKGNRIVRFVWDEYKVLIKTPRLQWQCQDNMALFMQPHKTYRTPEQTSLIKTHTQGLKISAKLPHSSSPLWRLHFVDDTMQVIKTPHHQPRYSVVQYKLNKYKVYNQAGNEVGKTKITNGIVDVDGFGIDLKIPTHTNSYAYALLMMYQIPEEVRFTLMAELFLKQL